MSRVLFLSTSSLSLYHLGVEVELVKEYIDKGHQVGILSCSCDLKTCYFNATQNVFGCALCISARSRAYSLLEKKQLTEHKYVKDIEFPEFPVFNSLDELLDYNYKGVNVGRGAASSYISLFLDYEISSTQEDRQYFIRELLKSAILTTESIIRTLDRCSFDEMIIFNGRFAEVFPAVEIAIQKGIPYKTHERGATLKRYQVSENSLPHSISYRTELMNHMWDNGPRDKEQIAQDWFDGQSFAIDGKNNLFTGNQVKEKLPDNFDVEKINITIFNSSEHETKVIREWRFPCYRHQNEAITRIVEHYSDLDKFHFYLRVHPHLTHVNSMQTNQIGSMNYPNLTIIPASSDIDSYTLAMNSDKVISFGSTIGIESTYLGQSSILFGRSLYENIDVCYLPKSYEKLFELIETIDLPAKPKSNTLRYAYYRCTYGKKPRYLRYVGKNKVYFRGKGLRPSLISTIPALIKNLHKVIHWNSLNKILIDQPVRLSNMFKLKSHFKKRIS